jgi:hypothetical protein
MMTLDEMPVVMKELFLMLPPPGTEWPPVERLRWLRAFDAVCRLVFKDDIALEVTQQTPGL